jgi:hypothetical protein
VLVHNLMLLGGIAGSGVAMFALARYLTGSGGAAVVAGVIFAFAPFRFEHFMHMEMQWAMWSPLAFLALHRLYDSGRLRDGIVLGACVALQMLSSIYYGIFLATFITIGALLWLPRDRKASLVPTVKALAAGALLAAIICGVYALPYRETHARTGDRPEEQVVEFSATPINYLSATAENWLYGATSRRGRGERHLFPGLTPLVLAMIGVLLRVPHRRTIVYLLLLVAAFEMSLGPHGYFFPFLRGYVPVFGGLRATARLGIFVLLFLGVLAAYGYQALTQSRSRMVRAAALVVCAAVLLAEYHVRLALVPYPNEPPPIYRVLAQQPKGVVAEFPVPRLDRLPGEEPGYAYMSIFHWFPLVNGYSGYYPESYLERLDRLRNFPNEGSIVQLRRDGVRYLVVHQSAYAPDARADLRLRIERSGAFTELGSFGDTDGEAWLFRMR